MFTGIQGICAQLKGGSLAKVGSSAKFGVAVFKASILNSLVGGPLAKVGLTANFGVLVFKASLLYYPGGSICQSMFIWQVLCTGIQGICALLLGDPLAKVGSSAKFGLVVFKASILDSLGGPSVRICSLPSFVYWYSRHLCSINGGSIGQSRFICQVWCTGIQGIYFQFTGEGPSAKVGLSANFGVLVFKASLLYYPGGSIWQSMFICQVLYSGIKSSMLY